MSRIDPSHDRAAFAAFLEAVPQAMLLADASGRVFGANELAGRLFGDLRDDLLGRSVDQLVPGLCAARPAWHEGSRRALVGRRRDGSEFPVEVCLCSLEGEDLVSCVLRDVGESHSREVRCARLAALVESSDDAIIGKTLDGTITSWNAGAERLFGYTTLEMVGQPIWRLVPRDREHEEREILAQLGQGRVQRIETVRLRKDGSEIHVAVTSSPLRAPSGELVGASKVVRDITGRRRADEALARAKEAAEAAARELEAFSYSVAHDLRAPLRGMNGFAQLLLDRYHDKLDAEGQDWLHEIVGNAARMTSLIDALLSLARVNRGEIRRSRVDLSSAARTIGERLASSAPERTVNLVVAGGLEAELDPILAQDLLENLLGNAWKFTGRTKGARIEVGVTDSRGVRTFFVRDNGAGFDMDFAERLFRPFARLHTTQEFPGTGIGLATVERIVRRHGGRVWAEGSVNAGATIYFSFLQPAPAGP